MRSRHKEEYMDGYMVIFEEYRNIGVNTINRFATVLVEHVSGRQVMVRYARYGTAIAVNNEKNTVDAVCIIYIKNGFIGLCVGDSGAIRVLARRFNLRSILALKKIDVGVDSYTIKTKYGNLFYVYRLDGNK